MADVGVARRSCLAAPIRILAECMESLSVSFVRSSRLRAGAAVPNSLGYGRPAPHARGDRGIRSLQAPSKAVAGRQISGVGQRWRTAGTTGLRAFIQARKRRVWISINISAFSSWARS